MNIRLAKWTAPTPLMNQCHWLSWFPGCRFDSQASNIATYLFLSWQVPFKSNRKVKHSIKMYNNYFVKLTISKFSFKSVINKNIPGLTNSWVMNPFCLNCKHREIKRLFQFKKHTSKAITSHMTSQFDVSSSLLTVIIQSFETTN